MTNLARGASPMRPAFLVLALLAAGAAFAHDRDDDHGRGRWFSAWTVSHGARQVPTGVTLSGSSFRMIVRPTASGDHVRVKIENTMGQAPVTFSALHREGGDELWRRVASGLAGREEGHEHRA